MTEINKYKNIVLEGGGIKGIGELGALKVLEERGILNNITSYGCSSVGSLIAGLLACGANVDWIKERMFKLDLNLLKDDDWGMCRDLYRLLNKKGWCKGEKLINIFKGYLKELGCNENITLKDVTDIFGIKLNLTTTKIKKENGIMSIETVILNCENEPDLELYKAVRMSAGFPFIYETFLYKGCEYIDGGLLENYPTSIFKKESDNTLGIKFSSVQTGNNNINCDYQDDVISLKDFGIAIINSLFEKAQQVSHKSFIDTIIINVGTINGMDFNLPLKDKQELWDKGRKACEEFLFS